MKHLYVHIPFCRTRCAYCDFASEPIAPHLRSGRVGAYLAALRVELRDRGACLDRPLETVYLGGGTPTALPREQLLALVAELAALGRSAPHPRARIPAGHDQPGSGAAAYRPAPPEAPGPCVPGAPSAEPPPAVKTVSPVWEFTVEANPGTVDASLLRELAAAGVTRLSLGVQSFSPALRDVLGRRVGQDEIEASLAALQSTGWDEWNLDLVFGIPGQDWSLAAADIDAAVAAAPTHISLYDLTYPARFASQVAARCGDRAMEQAAGFSEEHYRWAVRRLQAAGYRRYEVSNFALPGHECRHNLAYWRGEDYLGLGAAAVSTMGCERRTNPAGVTAYLDGTPPHLEELTPLIRNWEAAMLGLRTVEGVVEREVAGILDPASLDALLERGWVERACGKLRLNAGFLDVSNSVLATLLTIPDGGRACSREQWHSHSDNVRS